MSSETVSRSTKTARMRRPLRVALPFAVSAGLLAFLFTRIDLGEALQHVTGEVALRFGLPLLLFNLVTLGLEARSLHRVAAAGHATLPIGTAARIKAACYLLNVLNHALGAAGLSVLLRRRAGIGLANAAGMVFLISLFDIASVLGVAVLGASFTRVEALELRVGLVGIAIGAIAAGFAFLRFPAPLGPLEPLRRLEIFRAPRTAPLGLLLELAVLRGLFLLTFLLLAAALFHAFEIEVGPFRLAMNVAILIVLSAIPIAAAGLGTGQLAFVALFAGTASEAKLLAASLVLSIGLLATRALLGLLFAPEFTREARAGVRAESAGLGLRAHPEGAPASDHAPSRDLSAR
ncbi:MAG TPA: lysylphosphatidylglycerol synthase domain-containing protein [Myxococcota bacterium]|nr:lysylphosphatidylglycerol synthase domain-containing protein [Myxococcota bacterium]